MHLSKHSNFKSVVLAQRLKDTGTAEVDQLQDLKMVQKLQIVDQLQDLGVVLKTVLETVWCLCKNSKLDKQCIFCAVGGYGLFCLNKSKAEKY